MKQYAVDNELLTIACADCTISLHDRLDWEPVLRLDSSTGELTQVCICYACIDDIESLRNGPTWPKVQCINMQSECINIHTEVLCPT